MKRNKQSSHVAQWIKDPALSLQWLKLLLWHGFDLWPRDFCKLWLPQKERKKERGEGGGRKEGRNEIPDRKMLVKYIINPVGILPNWKNMCNNRSNAHSMIISNLYWAITPEKRCSDSWMCVFSFHSRSNCQMNKPVPGVKAACLDYPAGKWWG